MSFNSWEFLIFVGIFSPIYYFSKKTQLSLLFIGSSLFYIAFIPKYIFVLFTMIILDFYFGKKMAKTKKAKFRKFYLASSITSSILLLIIFKYFNFFGSFLLLISEHLGLHIVIPMSKIILPLGISFHTFQSLSYIFEVYKGKQPAEKNILVFATYVMFFPQLVAGPIERPQAMLHQFKTVKVFDKNNFTSGAWMFYWGFFKKVAVADRLATFVNPVYANPTGAGGTILFLATLSFYFQIYFDFSGYTDMARGLARILGFNLSLNFKTPYLAASLTEYWNCWHISLSSWFRDYLFTPLNFKMRRLGFLGILLSVLVTFAISGLWHGASWTYVNWGLFLGLCLVTEYALKSVFKRGIVLLPRLLSLTLARIFTILIVTISYVFFRSPNMQTAYYIFRKVYESFFGPFHLGVRQILNSGSSFPGLGEQFWVLVPCLIMGISCEIFNEKWDLLSRFNRLNLPFKFLFSWVAILVLLASGFWFHSATTFIYFQF